jgi:hypothetical protein
VPVDFFFEGMPREGGQHDEPTGAPFPQYVSDYLATADGLNLTKAFVQIPDAQLRRSIVNLVEQIADSEGSLQSAPVAGTFNRRVRTARR